MIFKPGLVEKIIAGKKTMTRRAVKAGETACVLNLERTATRFVPGCRYVPGRDYAVQKGRGGVEVARIKIELVRLELLGEITPTDAIAEGFKTTDHFFAYWERLHGQVDSEQPVWAMAFKLVLEERERYLGRRGGYTERPQLALTVGEDPKRPPAAVPASWQEQHSADRRQQFSEQRSGMPLEERLRAAREEAARRGISVARHEAAIEQRVQALERMLRGRAA